MAISDNIAQLKKQLVTRDTSIAQLVTFRILFGGLMTVSIVRFWANGWIASQYIEPKIYFPFIEGLSPLPGDGMYWVFAMMAIAAILVMIGLFYRYSAAAFFLLFTYVECLDKTNYLNHYYFVSLISFLLIFLPAHRQFSLDTRWGFARHTLRCARGYVLVLQLQLAVVYLFAGIAKINEDWLLRAQPMKLWLSANVHKTVLGELFRYKVTAFLFSWGGMLYDLFIPFLLFWRRTYWLAYGAVIVFHLLTWWLFPIGMFPFIMIAATTIFFPAYWHEKALEGLRKLFQVPVAPSQAQAAVSVTRPLQLVLGVFMLLQVTLPFRYLMYPGNVFWNEQGYRFSWRVMLMEKAGNATFTIEDKVNGRRVQASNYEHLTPQQEKMMATQPDMILQYAHYLAAYYKTKGFETPKVTVDSYVTLNGRRNRQFIDPNTDLAGLSYKWGSKPWINEY